MAYASCGTLCIPVFFGDVNRRKSKLLLFLGLSSQPANPDGCPRNSWAYLLSSECIGRDYQQVHVLFRYKGNKFGCSGLPRTGGRMKEDRLLEQNPACYLYLGLADGLAPLLPKSDAEDFQLATEVFC